SIRSFLLILSDGGFAPLQVAFQAFLLLQHITQAFLAEVGAPLNRHADVLTTDSFGEALSHSRIAVCYAKVDQAGAAANDGLDHGRESAAEPFFQRSKGRFPTGVSRGWRCGRRFR